MPKNYRNNNTIPVNIHRTLNRHIGLRSELIEFQKMAYTLQIEEEKIKQSNSKIELWVEDPVTYQVTKNEFENLIGYLLRKSVNVNFQQRSKLQNQSVVPFKPYDYEYLSLFSGGLDSIAIPFLPDYADKKGILHHTITHRIPQGKATRIYKKYFKPTQKQILVTSTYKNKVQDPGYLKTRGLVFLTNALCIASELNIKKIIIPENGPFMINFPVSTLADPTGTADPQMIESWTKIFNKVTNSSVEISFPFKNMTKSEVILSSGNSKLIKDTWSCSFFQGLSHMCGMCNSCLVRMLSCYAINEGENLENTYERNPFTINPADIGATNQLKYCISKDTATFCRSVINQEDLDPINQEKFYYLRKTYPILKNYSLDMMLGFQNLKRHYSSTRPLFTHFQKSLEYIDSHILEGRQSQLMTLKENLGWL